MEHEVSARRLFMVFRVVATCLISVGSNLGDRRNMVEQGLRELSKLPGTTLVCRSTLRATSAVGGPSSQPDFVNAAAVIDTPIVPIELLQRLQGIQRQTGRQEEARWGPRTLDLDLLLYDDLVLRSAELVIPHPRMSFRRFVLESAVEVAPEMIDPRNGWSVQRLWEHLQHAPNYLAITGLPTLGQTELARRAASRIGADAILQPMRTGHTRIDSPSRDLAVELEFLGQCMQLLPPRNMSTAGRIWISDFWIEESLAFAEGMRPDRNSAMLRRELHAQSEHALPPKLIVMLEASPEQYAAAPTLLEVQDRLVQMLSQTDCPPVLRLAATDAAWNLEEIVAAVAAMQ